MVNDLWESLSHEKRPVVLYGTGDGADKILDRLERLGVVVSGVFASNGFVRKRTFRGFEVESYRQITGRLGQNIVILVAFGSSRSNVLGFIAELCAFHTVLIPDMPVAGTNVWDGTFAEKNANEISAGRDLFSDEKSIDLFDSVTVYRLTGNPKLLFENLSTPEEIWKCVLRPQRYRSAVDVGAYNGDTAAELIAHSPDIKEILAVEPDEKNFSSLCRLATDERRITPVRSAAWDRREVLVFSRSGGRGSAKRDPGQRKTSEVLGLPLDDMLGGRAVDYIKIDSEGAEARAISGACGTISKYRPDLRIAVYHRPEDIFRIPLLINEICPGYSFYLRRTLCVPCWDLDIIAVHG